MNKETQIVEKTYVVKQQNLDHAACIELSQQIFSLPKQDLPEQLDLRCVQFADTSGLAFICQLASRVGSRFALVSVSPRLESCLRRIPEHRRPQVRQATSPKATSPPLKTNCRV